MIQPAGPRAARHRTPRALAALAALALASPAAARAADAPPAAEPLTTVGANGAGYLADPQPIRLAPSAGGHVQYLSGTTKAVIGCTVPIRAGCFDWAPITVDAAGLRTQIEAAGAAVTNIQNTDLFQDDEGRWHAAVTIGVNSLAHPGHWTVTAHAHPTAVGDGGAPPRAWTADTLLTGSFSDPAAGNYDGKYYGEDGRLYLLYVRNVAPPPQLRNEIVIQPMASATKAADAPATVLLAPGDRDGALASERFGGTQAKLVEAPYLTRVAGKYALVYSTGSYLTPGYKAGVAWSDTLLPGPGARYRKVLMPDASGIWGRPGTREVRYLIQSERPRWPNFTGADVIGPGVAAAVEEPGGAWWLFFNGFAPGDMPRGPMGRVDGSHRRPYGVVLRAAVPPGRTVAQASDAELAGWLGPVPRGEEP